VYTAGRGGWRTKVAVPEEDRPSGGDKRRRKIPEDHDRSLETYYRSSSVTWSRDRGSCRTVGDLMCGKSER
jgi:hypothetical protein